MASLNPNSPIQPLLTTQLQNPFLQVASKHSNWCTTMDEEFQAFQQKATWSLVPLLDSKNVVGCKWVYKLKRHSDRSIARYKA